jgi:hypothetical protein
MPRSVTATASPIDCVFTKLLSASLLLLFTQQALLKKKIYGQIDARVAE